MLTELNPTQKKEWGEGRLKHAGETDNSNATSPPTVLKDVPLPSILSPCSKSKQNKKKQKTHICTKIPRFKLSLPRAQATEFTAVHYPVRNADRGGQVSKEPELSSAETCGRTPRRKDADKAWTRAGKPISTFLQLNLQSADNTWMVLTSDHLERNSIPRSWTY